MHDLTFPCHTYPRALAKMQSLRDTYPDKHFGVFPERKHFVVLKIPRDKPPAERMLASTKSQSEPVQ